MKTKYQIKFVLLSAIVCIVIHFIAWLLFLFVAIEHSYSGSFWNYAAPPVLPIFFIGLASVAAFMAVRDRPKWVALLVFAFLPYILTVLSVVFIFWVFLVLSGAAIFTPASLLCYFVMAGLIRRYPPTSPSAEVESV